jgi:hypothetical protein
MSYFTVDKGILEKIMLRGDCKSETSTMRYLQNWNDSNWCLLTEFMKAKKLI